MSSSPRKPVVIVTADSKEIGGHASYGLTRKYIDPVVGIMQALPLILPPLGAALDIEALLEHADGLLFTGSPSNIEPHHYGEEASDPHSLRDVDRDATTLPLLRAAIERGLPVMAICRGFQEANVALGGKLHQAVHDVAGLDDHREDETAPLDVQYGPAHRARAVAGGWLEQVVGVAEWDVNSVHGQGIARLAPSLRAEAHAPDGLVEALRSGRGILAGRWTLVRAGRAVAPRVAGRRQPGIGQPVCGLRRCLQAICGAARERRARREGWVGGRDPRLTSHQNRRPSMNTAANALNTFNDLERWLNERRVTEVECLVPDLTGVARGKILPRSKLTEDQLTEDRGMRLPETIIGLTVTGNWPDANTAIDELLNTNDPDMSLVPDPRTVRMVPWATDPTAQVIHDCYFRDGTAMDYAPRQVLRNVLHLYEKQGWKPVVAPELEFYLVEKNTNADVPLRPPIGRSGRYETSRQHYSIDAVNEFDPLFEEIYDYCDAMDLDVDTLIHEMGAGQMEINFLHGDPLDLADKVFFFKRTLREAALARRPCATACTPPSWPSRWRANRAARCMCTRACSTSRPARTSSPTTTARRRRRSTTTSAGCRSTFRRRCPSWRPM